MSFEMAERIADAVLYEGYLLYPYRATATKNRMRWQLGVVVPRHYSENGSCEPWLMQTECLVDPGTRPELDLRIRFLQVQARFLEEAVDAQTGRFRAVSTLDVAGERLSAWDEAEARQLDYCGIDVGELTDREGRFAFDVPAGREEEILRDEAGKVRGRIIRERWPIHGLVMVAADPIGSLVKIRIRVENLSTCSVDADENRNLALRHSLISAHSLVAARDGVFLSLIDPPEYASQAAESCVNLQTWPVLVGEEGRGNVILSSPIILYDYPQIAPESPGDLFDSTEIDEILTLRTMTLTDEEKREARGTDPRSAAILDRIDTMPPEVLDRLRGAVRYLRSATEKRTGEEPVSQPWWDPGADASVSPQTDRIEIGGINVSKGSRVRLRPGRRRADAQDIFLDGRMATVQGVFFDVEDKNYVAVTLEDDPAADLYQWHGRFLYFAPDEVEPVGAAEGTE